MHRFLASLLLTVSFLPVATAENWPMWRGPRGDGTSSEKNVPLRWNGETGEGIAWKVPVPGVGYASPVVYRDRVFLVTCREKQLERNLLCYSLDDGRLLWERTVISAPLEKKHGLNSHASSTAAVDGRHVYVTFFEPTGEEVPDKLEPNKKQSLGKIVVAAYDHRGNQQWIVRPGPFASIHGFSVNPILYKDMLIVNGDHDGDGYIVALDRNKGREVWRAPRENHIRSYSTPLIRTIKGREQLMLSGDRSVASYDPNTGEQQWILDGPTDQFVATVVYGGGYLFVTGGYPERHMLAIRPDGELNVTHTHVAWRTREAVAYVPSPIVAGDYFLVVTDGGVVSSLAIADGRRVWKERLGRHYSNSPVSAGGKVYFLDDDGITKIIAPGEEFNVVAENPLGERCLASPAISAGRILIRGEKHLWCIDGTSKK